MSFDVTEYQERVLRLIDEMKQRGLDAILLDEGEATSYYFGIDPHLSSYRAGVLTANGEAFFVLRELDAIVCKSITWINDIEGHTDWENPVDIISQKLRSYGLERARIGVDHRSHALTISTLNRLQQNLPHATFVDVESLPWILRLVKSPAEIEKMRVSGSIADRTLIELAKVIKPGFTERDLTRIAVECYVRFGGDATYPATMVVRSDDETDVLHGYLSERTIKYGDVLHMEVIPRYHGYGTRAMRPMILGAATDTVQQLSSALFDLQNEQFAAIKPGKQAKEVDAIVRNGAIARGLRTDYPNITGYTMGYYPDFSIRPSDFTRTLSPSSDWAFEAGMAFHIYTSAGGIGVSDTVVVTPQGIERLTNLPRSIIEIE